MKEQCPGQRKEVWTEGVSQHIQQLLPIVGAAHEHSLGRNSVLARGKEVWREGVSQYIQPLLAIVGAAHEQRL